MKKLLISFIIPMFVSACDKDGNLGAEESPAWHNRVSTETKIEYFTPKCVAYGYKRGTAELRECVVQEIRQSEADAEARMRSISKPITCRTYGNRTTCY